VRVQRSSGKHNTVSYEAFPEQDKNPLFSDKGKNDPSRFLEKQETSNELAAAIDQLPEKWAYILRARFGINGPEQSCREIAKDIHISFQVVNKIEKRALKKLKALLGG